MRGFAIHVILAALGNASGNAQSGLSFPSGHPSGSSLPSIEPSGFPSVPLLPSSLPNSEPSTQSGNSTARDESYPPSIPTSFRSSLPSKAPSGSFSPSIKQSVSPSYGPSNNPSGSSVPSSYPMSLPSSLPSTFPSGSFSPSFKPSDTPSYGPSDNPSGSSIPSSFPSGEPSRQSENSVDRELSEIPTPDLSSNPSWFPSSVPSSFPSSVPSSSPSGSSGPSSIPSNLPSRRPSGSSLPSLLPSSTPSGLPSVSPSLSLMPSPVGIASPTTSPSVYPAFIQTPSTVSAPLTVSIPCRTEMDDTTILAFETATADFLTAFLPTSSGVIVTSVVVTKQTLVTAKNRWRLRRELQESSELEVSMIVNGTQAPGSEDDVSFESVLNDVVAENSDAFEDKLGGVSSFFRAEFAYAASGGSEGSETSESQDLQDDDDSGNSTEIIVCSAIAIIVAAVIGAFLFVKYHKRSQEKEVDSEQPRIDLMSWSSTTPKSLDGKINFFNEHDITDVYSPTESEVYKEDRFGSGHGKLSPIAESGRSRMENGVDTPRNSRTPSQATPRGSTFGQMDLHRSQGSGKDSKLKAGNILGDLENMEDEWAGQLISKVDAVSETPKQNNLEKFKVGSRTRYES